MSRIDDLIAAVAPQGVPYRRVGDVFETVATPRGIKRSDYSLGKVIPIVDQGQSLIAGYTDDDSLKIVEGPYVVFGDHTRAVKWIDFVFAVGADGTKVLEAKSGVLPKYAYYAMANLDILDRGYNRHWTVVRDLRIALPPLEVQQEIVRVLDQFTRLEAELKAELEARRKQYEYYRERLLTFKELAE
ncbi:restriction endonuclease subunit S [Brachybacterium sp. AOP42-E1-35]|uniref:restriction endonuclease subunit S n=1 Tax=Brachybacterium sp. AOP42-E1-35 TaxID=3457664 RepID=UPI00402A8323